MSPPRYRTLTIGAVVVVLAWGAFSFGGVYQWAYWPLAAGCAAAGAIGLRHGRHPLAEHRAIVVALAAVALAMAAQLAPLPVGVLRQVSPGTLAIINQVDVAFTTGPGSAHPLSIAPRATATALALFAAFCVLLLGLLRVLTPDTARRLATAVAVLGVIVALVGIVQKPFYAGKVYGFWTPLMPGSAFGPFINKNHFAGWMLMALPLTLGLLWAGVAEGMRGVRADWRSRILWLSSADANRTVLLAAGVAVMALALALTMSRSGIAAAVFAMALTTCVAMRRLEGRRRVLAPAVFLIVLSGIPSFVGVRAIAARFSDGDLATLNDRVPIWLDTAGIVKDFWLTGTGLNTYRVASLFYQQRVDGVHLREAHNDYLQLAAEGGMLVGVPIAAAALAFVRSLRRRFRERRSGDDWLRIGAATGLLAIALQSVVDFSLQMPGNAALFAVLCAVALHRGEESTS